MKKLSLIPILLLTCGALAQDFFVPGSVIEGLQMDSAVLGRPLRFALYLPPDYATSSRRYPVVYLLHGYTDDETAWIQFGEAPLTADRGIAHRDFPPMIIVMPDGGVGWYINDYLGKNRWEDAFIQEFIPYIDGHYRTRPQREFRAISGLSMGGWGTLLMAMRHPDLFSSCAAFSSGLWTDDEIVAMDDSRFEEIVGGLFGSQLKGKARLNNHFRQYNPLDLAKSLPVEKLKQVRYYIDCGDDDFLIRGNCALHLLLKDRNIPHEFRVHDGAHSWNYWRGYLSEGLKFIGQGFNR